MATPIGNLSDITYRAVETLKNVDLIACEDTRHTLNLLRHFGIQKKLVRYDEHVHESSSYQISKILEQGQSIALVTDAGTPGVSDPGRRLVHAVRKAGYRVIPIPGASSPIAALSAAGFTGEGFIFLGFLSRKKGKALRVLQEALLLGKTVIVLESPFRILSTLNWIQDCSPKPRVMVVRELTKIHEEFIEGDAETVRHQLEQREKIGECLLLLHPETDPQHDDENENEAPNEEKSI